MDDKKPGFIRRSFRALTKFITALRLLTVNLLFVAVVAVILAMLSGGQLPKIPDKGALVLNIEGTLVDQKSYVAPLTRLMGTDEPERQEVLLQDVIDAVNYAKNDDRINTIVLSLDHFVYGGISKISELSKALRAFRKSGKKIIAVGDNYSQDQYLLASQADKIYINPMGSVWLEGYSVFRNYFKKALDKLQVNFHVFRVGEFKSAMEPYIRNNMSEDAREANLQWLTTLWNQYTSEVARRRHLKPADINHYVNDQDKLLQNYHGDTAAMAVAVGLVDGVKTREEMNRYLVKVVGAKDDDGYFQGIGYQRYLWLMHIESPKPSAKDKVGLIVASGNIVDGYQLPGTIGGDSTAQLIRQARLDNDVRAVVMRVDSGGGSAFASEIIRREIQLLQQAGKPFVVSMGSVAASGGYWISSSADQIWATPTTITGSIGIFGAFPTIDKTLSKLGVTTDGVGTTKLAGAMRMDRPLNPIAAHLIQDSVEHGYSRFLDIVAEGRDMNREDVAKIAQGHVWSGVDAKKLGLVDELGGLSQAIDAAASLAGLKKYSVKTIELPLSPQERLVRELLGGEVASGLRHLLGSHTVLSQLNRWLMPFKSQLAFLQQMNDPHDVYVHCAVCVAP